MTKFLCALAVSVIAFSVPASAATFRVPPAAFIEQAGYCRDVTWFGVLEGQVCRVPVADPAASRRGPGDITPSRSPSSPNDPGPDPSPDPGPKGCKDGKGSKGKRY